MKSPTVLGFFLFGVLVKKLLSVLLCCLTLTACSSKGGFSIPELPSSSPALEFENMYLRGVFNWWEADPSYRFARDGFENSEAVWKVEVELIADGQPYDFRLSDDKWTPSQSCGGKYKGQPVMLGTTVYLACEQGSENLQFTPSSTGMYRFTIHSAGAKEVALKVTKI